MPAKNSVFMARVFIDHRRDELHMGENHEKVTFLPLKVIKSKMRKYSFKRIMYVFLLMTLALHYALENVFPKCIYLFIY